MDGNAAKMTDSLTRLGPLGMTAVLLAAGLIGGGYMILAEVIDIEHVLVEDVSEVGTHMVELEAAITRQTEHQDVRYDAWQDAQANQHRELVAALRASTAATLAVCFASANGDPEARRFCEDALMP